MVDLPDPSAGRWVPASFCVLCFVFRNGSALMAERLVTLGVPCAHAQRKVSRVAQPGGLLGRTPRAACSISLLSCYLLLSLFAPCPSTFSSMRLGVFSADFRGISGSEWRVGSLYSHCYASAFSVRLYSCSLSAQPPAYLCQSLARPRVSCS